MTAPSTRPTDYPGYSRLWTATTVSDFGTYVTMIAVQLLVIDQLHASPVQAGLVNAVGHERVGAPLGGVLAGTLGYRPALWVGIGGIGLAAGWLALSRFRHASVTDATPSLAG